MEHIACAFQVAGVVVIVIGAVDAGLHGFRDWTHPSRYFDVVRRELDGR